MKMKLFRGLTGGITAMAKKITIEIDDSYAKALSLTAVGQTGLTTNVTCVVVDLRKTDYIKIYKSGKFTTERLEEDKNEP